MKAAALAALLLVARVAAADPEADAENAFRDAVARGDIAALEQLGGQRPVTRWTDDAWAEAARFAIKANDFARARTDLEQVIAIGSDAQQVRRARNELERIASFAGAGGEWMAIAAEHERLAPALHTGGDPRPALAKLEQLVRAHPRYPRAAMLMVALASGWEREGDADRAIAWLREAQRVAAARAELTPGQPARSGAIDKLRVSAELVRTLIRAGELDAADAELALLAREATPGLIANLRAGLERAELRRTIRWGMWSVLAALLGIALFALRRSAGSWHAALRRLARPPTEALFILPIGTVIVVFSFTGNPLIARTVLAILVGGVVTSWLSGAVLDGRGRVGFARAVTHAALAVVAIVASVYLAVDRGHVIDFVIETWHQGHETG